MINCRRKAREAAVQALYQCDALADWSPECISLYFTQFQEEAGLSEADADNHGFARKLVQGVIENLDFIDTQISSASEHWSMSRMPRVDRNILRLAVYEIAFCDDIPASVTINEAIEVAKRFSGDEAPMFINGVIDKIAHSLEPKLTNKAGWKKEVVNF